MSSVFDLLDREWRRLKHDVTAARSLGDAGRLAGHAGSLAGIEQFVRAAAPVDADPVLLALASRAVDRDALAARVLLQLLLPGTRNLARRWWTIGDGEERAAAAVAAVYARIRSYPVTRRPSRVAANILMDAARELRRLALSTSGASSLPHFHAHPAASGDVHPAAELIDVLVSAVGDGIIERDDAVLIARSHIMGDRVADIALNRRLTARTLRDRRKRAESALVAAHQQRLDHCTSRCHATR